LREAAVEPRTPLEAVTHPDPYPYYAALVAERPFGRDGGLGLWVAASAAAVEAVLTSPDLGVRPGASPVPDAIAGSPAGDIFGHLIRMRDGEYHAAVRPALVEALDTGDLRALSETAGRLAEPILRGGEPVDLGRLAFEVPATALALAVGVPEADAGRVVPEVAAFARGIGAAATPEAVEAGKRGAAGLLEFFGPLTARAEPGPVRELARRCPAGGADPLAAVANAVGILSQAYEATAGLVGNSLVALARDPGLAATAAASLDGAEAVVREVVRHDSPVQNTRRFARAATAVAGVEVAAGDAVLVLVAAANRDPAANPDPHRFDPGRAAPRQFTFGAGPHRCPGEAFAVAIAARVVHEVARGGHPLDRLRGPVGYQPLPNVRIPDLGTGA
jgi:cytochrome P450